MDIKINNRSFFVFDLDDTLYQEIDFLKSAYAHISEKLSVSVGHKIYDQMWARYKNKENVFSWIVDNYQHLVPEMTLQWLLKEYREHVPAITLSRDTFEFLQRLKERKVPAGLITDGRSITQRNKLKALGIEDYFNDIIISEEFGSEKPDERNFLYFLDKYPESDFYFFGDNTSKDFIVPSKLKWTTFCLINSGNNVHLQSLDKFLIADFSIESFKEIQFS